LRLIRIGAWGMAAGGLLLLWLANHGVHPASNRIPFTLPDLPFAVYTVLKPHVHWMLWCGIACLLLSEPPQPVTAGKAGWRRFLVANRPIAMATLVFGLAGLLGFMVMHATPLTPSLISLGLLTATGIAALPLLHGVRHVHTLGIILLPLACELSGLSPAIAIGLGLQ